jgi:tetratricopeptide (TPR) repeat protein
VSIDDVRSGLAAAACVSMTVAAVFLLLDFTVTTVKQGVVKSATELSTRLEKTMERLSGPIEEMILQPDEMESVRLFEKFPYPTGLTVRRAADGRTIEQFALAGVNLDWLRRVEIAIPGASRREETSPSRVGRDADQVEFRPSLLTELAGIPRERVALVTAIGTEGSPYTFEVPLTIDDSRSRGDHDDPLFRTRPRASPRPSQVAALPGTPGGPRPAPSGAPATTTGGGAGGSGDGPGRSLEEGRRELADLIEKIEILGAPVRAQYRDRVMRGRFDDLAVADLFESLANSGAPGAAIRTECRAVLNVRYMRQRRIGTELRPIHNATPDDVDAVLLQCAIPFLVATIRRDSSVEQAFRTLLVRPGPAGEPPGTHGSPRPSAKPETSAGGTKHDEPFFRDVFQKEQTLRDCLSIVEMLQKAYDAYTANIMTPPPFDPGMLQTKGFLEYLPACPSPRPDGTTRYEMDPGSHRVRCTFHGNKANMWDEHRRYDLHFRELDRARILARGQGRRKDAIRALRNYLTIDRGREERNLYARAYLARLYFQDGEHGEAAGMLKELAERFPRSVRFASQAATSFYVKNNDSLARQFVAQALAPAPGEFDRSLDEESSLYEIYQLQDEASWMRLNLDPVQVLPSGEERKLPMVRYAEFALKQRPEMRSRVCYENLGGIKALLPKIVVAMRPQSDFKQQADRLGRQLAHLASLPDYEKKEHARARETIVYVQGQMADTIGRLLVEAGAMGGPAMRACPSEGIYHMDDRCSLQCTRHPGILPATRLQVSPPLSDRECESLDIIVQQLLVSSAPTLRACMDRQRRILGNFLADDGALAVPADASLDELIRSGRVDAGLARPSASERYRFQAYGGDEAVLRCSEHLSLQELARKVPGFPLGLVPGDAGSRQR